MPRAGRGGVERAPTRLPLSDEFEDAIRASRHGESYTTQESARSNGLGSLGWVTVAAGPQFTFENTFHDWRAVGALGGADVPEPRMLAVNAPLAAEFGVEC